MEKFIAAAIGSAAGILSGLTGIGGGIIMIPALSLFLGYSQHKAQGTTLAAMILPIGILAAAEYYKRGEVNVVVAVIIAAFFIAGGFIGAKAALAVNTAILNKLFAAFLIILGVKMLISK